MMKTQVPCPFPQCCAIFSKDGASTHPNCDGIFVKVTDLQFLGKSKCKAHKKVYFCSNRVRRGQIFKYVLSPTGELRRVQCACCMFSPETKQVSKIPSTINPFVNEHYHNHLAITILHSKFCEEANQMVAFAKDGPGENDTLRLTFNPETQRFKKSTCTSCGDFNRKKDYNRTQELGQQHQHYCRTHRDTFGQAITCLAIDWHDETSGRMTVFADGSGAIGRYLYNKESECFDLVAPLQVRVLPSISAHPEQPVIYFDNQLVYKYKKTCPAFNEFIYYAGIQGTDRVEKFLFNFRFNQLDMVDCPCCSYDPAADKGNPKKDSLMGLYYSRSTHTPIMLIHTVSGGIEKRIKVINDKFIPSEKSPIRYLKHESPEAYRQRRESEEALRSLNTHLLHVDPDFKEYHRIKRNLIVDLEGRIMEHKLETNQIHNCMIDKPQALMDSELEVSKHGFCAHHKAAMIWATNTRNNTPGHYIFNPDTMKFRQIHCCNNNTLIALKPNGFMFLSYTSSRLLVCIRKELSGKMTKFIYGRDFEKIASIEVEQRFPWEDSNLPEMEDCVLPIMEEVEDPWLADQEFMLSLVQLMEEEFDVHSVLNNAATYSGSTTNSVTKEETLERAAFRAWEEITQAHCAEDDDDDAESTATALDRSHIEDDAESTVTALDRSHIEDDAESTATALDHSDVEDDAESTATALDRSHIEDDAESTATALDRSHIEDYAESTVTALDRSVIEDDAESTVTALDRSHIEDDAQSTATALDHSDVEDDAESTATALDRSHIEDDAESTATALDRSHIEDYAESTVTALDRSVIEDDAESTVTALDRSHIEDDAQSTATALDHSDVEDDAESTATALDRSHIEDDAESTATALDRSHIEDYAESTVTALDRSVIEDDAESTVTALDRSHIEDDAQSTATALDHSDVEDDAESTATALDRLHIKDDTESTATALDRLHIKDDVLVLYDMDAEDDEFADTALPEDDVPLDIGSDDCMKAMKAAVANMPIDVGHYAKSTITPEPEVQTVFPAEGRQLVFHRKIEELKAKRGVRGMIPTVVKRLSDYDTGYSKKEDVDDNDDAESTATALDLSDIEDDAESTATALDRSDIEDDAATSPKRRASEFNEFLAEIDRLFYEQLNRPPQKARVLKPNVIRRLIDPKEDGTAAAEKEDDAESTTTALEPSDIEDEAESTAAVPSDTDDDYSIISSEESFCVVVRTGDMDHLDYIE